MPSPILIILVCLTLSLKAALIGLAHLPKFQSYHNLYLETADQDDTAELLRVLALPLGSKPNERHEAEGLFMSNSRTAKLLARIRDKQAIVAASNVTDTNNNDGVNDGFNITVGQLLELRQCKRNQCLRTELTRRETVCDRLLNLSEANKSWRMMSGEQPAEYYIFKHLHNYCRHVNQKCLDWCAQMHMGFAKHAVATQVPRKIRRSLMRFQQEVFRLGMLSGSVQSLVGNKQLIQQVLDSIGQTERAKLVDACERLKTVLADIYPYYDTEQEILVNNFGSWVVIDRNCKVVLNTPVDKEEDKRIIIQVSDYD